MPIYEYVCLECGEKTDVLATISEKEKGLKITCPKCGSKKMSQAFGSFMVLGSSGSKSKLPSREPSAGTGCCG